MINPRAFSAPQTKENQMLEFTQHELRNGRWAFRYGEHEGDQLGDLARKLVVAGFEDQPWRCGGLSGPSLHRLACLTVSEPDRGAVHHARYAPHPHAVTPELVVRVMAQHPNAGIAKRRFLASGDDGGVPVAGEGATEPLAVA